MAIRQLNLIGTILIIAISSSLFTPLRLCGQANPKQATSDQQLKAGEQALLPQFAVATVRLTRSGNGMFFFGLMPDGITIKNIPLQVILRAAFGMEDDRILGSPGWAKSEQLDIEAKVDASDVSKLKALTIEQRRAMLLPLLVDRFDLHFHYEKRNLPIYSLVIANGGPKLKVSNAEFAQRHLHLVGRGELESTGTGLRSLIPKLSQELGRTVLDNSGLTGLYDYTLQWTPETGLGALPGGSNGEALSNSAPDLLTALQEQLGLKLKAEREFIEAVVIDHISKLPSEN